MATRRAHFSFLIVCYKINALLNAPDLDVVYECISIHLHLSYVLDMAKSKFIFIFFYRTCALLNVPNSNVTSPCISINLQFSIYRLQWLQDNHTSLCKILTSFNSIATKRFLFSMATGRARISMAIRRAHFSIFGYNKYKICHGSSN